MSKKKTKKIAYKKATHMPYTCPVSTIIFLVNDQLKMLVCYFSKQ